MKKSSLTLLAGLIVLATTTSAFAQEPDNPFAAYEGGKRTPVQETTTTTPNSSAQPQSATAKSEKNEGELTGAALGKSAKKKVIDNTSDQQETALVVEEVVPIERLLERNHFSLGLTSGVAFDANNSDVAGGKENRNSALNADLQLFVGYNVWKNVTVELGISAMWRRSARGLSTSVTENDWVFAVRGWYSYPFLPRTAVIGGISLGGFFGYGEQEVGAGGSSTWLGTKTAGFYADLNAGLEYVIGNSWRVRMFINYTYMVGNEKVPAPYSQDLFSSSMHAGLGLGVSYTF